MRIARFIIVLLSVLALNYSVLAATALPLASGDAMTAQTRGMRHSMARHDMSHHHMDHKACCDPEQRQLPDKPCHHSHEGSCLCKLGACQVSQWLGAGARPQAFAARTGLVVTFLATDPPLTVRPQPLLRPPIH